MAYPLVRGAHLATNALHSLIYFVPETEQQLTSVGLKPGRMCYFAGRAAPLGAVSGGIVTATFYNFSPGLVAGSIPQAWNLARPEAIVAARFAAADAALTRLLGPDVIASADMITLAELTREAATACRPEGRPLYAGHADLDWPEAPHLVMWHALSLLREYRGDGHICALLGAGLSGLEALVTHTATGRGFVSEFAQASRGWSDEEWKGAVEALTARGLLAADGSLTPAGDALRAHVEEETDRLDADPWQHLGDQGTEEVVRIGKAMTRTVMKAGRSPGRACSPGSPSGARNVPSRAERRPGRRALASRLVSARRYRPVSTGSAGTNLLSSGRPGAPGPPEVRRGPARNR